jgi:hypothetical protein
MAENDRKKLGKVIARAWLDKDFHDRLLKDPHAVLTEAGIHVKGKVHVHESTDTDHHLVLPHRPAALDEHVRKQKEKPGTCSHDPQLCSSLTPELCSSDGEHGVLCDKDRAPQLCSTL